MSNNQVLLLQPIEGLGAEGDTVTVRAGYARNFLLPQKIALPITQANRKHVESLLKAREVREANELEGARTLSERIAAVNIAIALVLLWPIGVPGFLFYNMYKNHLHSNMCKNHSTSNMCKNHIISLSSKTIQVIIITEPRYN